MNERLATSLRFAGDWPWWLALGLAGVAGAAVWWLYRRELRGRSRGLRVLLPALRSVAVVLLVLMLAGPVLHHRQTIREPGRLWLFVDGSQSMALTDPTMDSVRKVAISRQLGAEARAAAASEAAMERFDAMPRWQRLQALLLEGGGTSLLAALAAKHEVQLFVLEGGVARKIWESTRRDFARPDSLPKPAGQTTDLATGLKSGAIAADPTPRGAAVLFSDGQHNDGAPPAEVAQLLGGRGIPVYAVGFGASGSPPDLAVVTVETPDAVFFEDRLRGRVMLKDDMPAGQPLTLTIKDGEAMVWERQLVTEGRHAREVEFEFPLGDVARRRIAGQREGPQLSSVAVALTASVTHLAGDREPANDAATFRVRAITQKRRILLLDGSPRWETRYLRNLFERDPQWDIRTVIADAAAWPRGDRAGAFPPEQALLDAFDLVIFGEIPRAAFEPRELEWLRDFVSRRGGAIIFIDGPRGSLKEYASTPIAPLFPVEWTGASVREGIARLALTARAESLAPFTLAPDRAQNADLWRTLPPPHWLSGATPLPGAETLIEADVGGRKVAAAVYRPFGAGKVYYHAFDDSWRWRYEVADEHHVRAWNQLAHWIAELPFAVRDGFISLDAGAITYRPGDSAELRARLRDGAGRPVNDAAAGATLFRDGKKVATIRLVPDDNGGGLYRGKSAPLEPGDYEVGIESAAIPAEDSTARIGFKVEPRDTGELVPLALNEDLLRQMAVASGGEFLREEEIARLPALLAPTSAGRVVESDTAPGQSGWTFTAILLLLSAEWIARKRAGLL